MLSNFGFGTNLEFPAFPETERIMISAVENNLHMRMLTVLNKEVEFLINSLHSFSSPAD